MKMNNKAEGGFMEAMAAVMIITVTLTAFIGLLTYTSISDTGETIEIETSYLNKLSIKNEKIVGDIQNDLQEQVDINEYEFIRLTVKIIGLVSDDIFIIYAGEKMTNNVASETGTIILQSDDGRRLAASYEMVVWI